MKHFFYLLILATAFISCSDDDDPMVDNPVVVVEDDPYTEGFFVTNEGPFNNGFGTVDYINSDFSNIESSIFQSVNDSNLGNIVQSMAMGDSLAYVVANVSSQITVVDKGTFEGRSVITSGLNNPRHMILFDEKGYVTNWGDPNDPLDDFVAVVDLITNEVINQIPVGEGPEDVLISGTSLYVAHQGGFGVNNIISVISLENEAVTTTVEVGDVPNSMSFDASGRLVVLSGGAPAFTGAETGGRLSIIDTAGNQVVASFFFATEEHPNYLNIVGDDAYYYLNGMVFKTTVEGFTNTTQPFITDVNFYNMTILSNRTIAGCDAADFASNGSIELYDASTGDFLNSIEAGIIPGNVYSID